LVAETSRTSSASRNEGAKQTLDDIDRLLIRELIADGRATLSNLAEKANLSVSAVQSRVRRLGKHAA